MIRNERRPRLSQRLSACSRSASLLRAAGGWLRARWQGDCCAEIMPRKRSIRAAGNGHMCTWRVTDGRASAQILAILRKGYFGLLASKTRRC